MNVDLELYKVFYIVAKNKNMTKASNELHISQPAISQSIKKLESQLGGTLFLRSNKGMELTKEGEMFYEYIKGALNLINNAEIEFTSFKDLSQGEVKIGASTTLTKLLLTNPLKKFHQDYPNINIQIKNDLTNNLINDLKQGKLDFVILTENPTLEKSLNLEKLTTLKQGFIYNQNYFQDHIKTLKELNTIPLILQKKESNTRKQLDTILKEQNIYLFPKMEVVSQELINEFVNIGLGIGFTIIKPSIQKTKEIKELKINKKIPPLNIYLATNKLISQTLASKELIKYLKESESMKNI